jgi:heat shock protein HspQ
MLLAYPYTRWTCRRSSASRVKASTRAGIELPRKLLQIASWGRRTGVMEMKTAKFSIGQVVRHRLFSFRGVIFDVDPQFSNTEEWYEAIPADVRPNRDQPFYHLLAENEETEYIAYVSEQNLLADQSGEPVRHPQLREFFNRTTDGRYEPKGHARH